MTLLKFLLKSFVASVFLAGILTVLSGFVLLYICLYRTNTIQAWMPKEQVRVIEPVTLQLYGPRFVVQGDRVYYHAMIGGQTGKPVWSIVPYRSGVLNEIDDGRTVEFSSLEEGKFTITAVVAGEGMHPASGHIEFENISMKSEEDLVEAQPIRAMEAAQMLPAPPPPPTASELTMGAFQLVASENKAAEARFVAGSIYSVANRLRSGLLPANFDVPLEIEKQANKALGDNAGAWGVFMVSIDRIIEEYRSRGQVNTAVSQAPVLMEIANTLQSIR